MRIVTLGRTWRSSTSDIDEFQFYSVIRPHNFEEILRARNDIGALRDESRNAEQLNMQEPDDWVDAMAQDISADPAVRIAELARDYSVTKEHASRRFRQRYLMTPSAFRFETRFRRALELLRHTQHGLSEIAQSTGYACDDKWLPTEYSDCTRSHRTIRAYVYWRNNGVREATNRDVRRILVCCSCTSVPTWLRGAELMPRNSDLEAGYEVRYR